MCGDERLSDEELAANLTTLGDDYRAHPLDDELYAERTPDFEKITVPLLSTGNWGGQGLHLRGNVEGYLRAGSSQKWLEMHGLEHWSHFYTDYGRELQLRFFDHFLKGEDNGWQDQPPLQLNIRHVDSTFVVRHEQSWPLERTEWTRFYLDADTGALDTEAPSVGGVGRLRHHRRRRQLHPRAPDRADGDHRAARGEALRRVQHGGRGSVPRRAGLLSGG